MLKNTKKLSLIVLLSASFSAFAGAGDDSSFTTITSNSGSTVNYVTYPGLYDVLKSQNATINQEILKRDKYIVDLVNTVNSLNSNIEVQKSQILELQKNLTTLTNTVNSRLVTPVVSPTTSTYTPTVKKDNCPSNQVLKNMGMGVLTCVPISATK